MKSNSFGVSKLTFRTQRKIKNSPAKTRSTELETEILSGTNTEPVPKPKDREGLPTQDEILSSLTQIEEAESNSDGEDCELHIYETRYDTRGQEVVLRAGTKSRFKEEAPKRKSHRACLVLNRYYHFPGDRLAYTELEIQSKHIIRAFRQVIGSYDGLDLESNLVIIKEPPRCIFHYRTDLQKYAEKSGNEFLKSHMDLCLQYADKILYREIKINNASLLESSRTPDLEHRHLWVVFRPGCLVYEKHGDIERVSRLRSMRGGEHDDNGARPWILNTERVHYTGSVIGLTSHSIEISPYDGFKSVRELNSVPLYLHPEERRIRRDLLERGRKFLSLCGMRHCFYDGPAYMGVSTGDTSSHVNVRGRIILDLEEYGRTSNNCSTTQAFILKRRTFDVSANDKLEFSDEDTITCHHHLPGYSLQLKRWGLFWVDQIGEVVYNDQAFAGLVFPEQKKRLIYSLVGREPNTKAGDDFDDLIQGKGKGLVFLLHGPPGVGKTYTAESVADHTKRPLIKVTSGELVPGPWMEERLMRLFFLATRWNCIVLLDEAEVFMQQRTHDNVQGNFLVSTLLRVLEYYEGIIFLTTNRLGTIDSAFKSRIHLAITYPPLSEEARRQMWSSMLKRANRGEAPRWLTPDFLSELAKTQTNGREIKNIVRTGYALAQNEGRELSVDDILMCLESLKQFEDEFVGFSGEV